MATTTTITSTYAGEFAGEYIAAALLSASTIDGGGITVKPNIKYKEVIKKVATDTNVIKDASCDFTDTGAITLTERIIAPEQFQVNLELCKKDFISDWDAASMGYSSHDNLPSSFSDFLIAHVAGLVAEKTEQTIWHGANATAGEFDGLVVLATADSDVVDVAGASQAAGGVTASNVIAELGKVVDAIPSALYGKEDLTLYVAQNVYRAYVRALGGFGASGLGANGYDGKGTNQAIDAAYFDGVKVMMVQGLDDDYMVAAQKSNLFFGTGLLNDQNDVRVLDMADKDGSDNVRVIMRYSAGVQYGIGSEIVLYTPTT